MILIIGPAFSGKMKYAKSLLLTATEAEKEILSEVQDMITDKMQDGDMESLADRLCEGAKILTASETGAGIVPVDPKERKIRELQGRLLQELVRRADRVVRVYYGIPETLKGK